MIKINRILIAIVGGVIVIGAVILLSTSANKSNTAQTTPTPTIQTETTTAIDGSSVQDAASETTITITSTGYEPSTITIRTGTKVVWINTTGQTVNVSSNDHPSHLDYSPLNLGNFGDGESISMVFDMPGTYGYHNHLNASQTGTVIVTQ